MIRNPDKIFGEMNDPNTVIATSVLEDGMPVVGAGNHGIKTIDLGAKKIMYVDSEGKVKGFAYSTANKVIGTDASGNLVLKDMPTGSKTIQVKISSVTSPANHTCSVITTSDIYGSLLSDAGDISVIKVVKSTDSYTNAAIDLTLSTPLVLSATTNVRIIVAVGPTSLNEAYTPYGTQLDILNSSGAVTNLLSQSQGGGVNFANQNGFVNKVLSLSAGTYNRLRFTSITLKGTAYLKVTGCLIVGG